MFLYLSCILLVLVNSALSGQGSPRQNIVRLARDDKSPRMHADFIGSDAHRSPIEMRGLDRVGGGELIRLLDPLTGGRMMRSLEPPQLLASLDNFKGGEVLGLLDGLTGGDILNSLEATGATSVLAALQKVPLVKHRYHPSSPKRTLDTLTGMAFGESKRFDSLSGSTFGLSKRDFDEIDNVGFTGFAKRGPFGRHSLALAKRNFDEIDRTGFDTYSKRNFDEIDRAGFENFEKRDRKE